MYAFLQMMGSMGNSSVTLILFRSLRRSSFAHPHEISASVYALAPPPAHEEASNFCLSENSIMIIRQMKHFRKTALPVLAD